MLRLYGETDSLPASVDFTDKDFGAPHAPHQELADAYLAVPCEWARVYRYAGGSTVHGRLHSRIKYRN